MKNKHIESTPKYKYKEEIAKDLGISISTLKRWLTKQGLKIPRGYVSPENQNIIHSKLGLTKNSGSIQVNKQDLQSGMYIYSLVVDGKEVQSKRMIVN